MNKQQIKKISMLMKNKHLVNFTIIIFILSLSNIVTADSQGSASARSVAEDKSAAVYEGTLTGEWSGETMGVSVNGTFTVNIAADGTVSGTYSGFASGTITGTVSSSGDLNAKGSAGITSWNGKINSSGGRLSGKGTWSGYSIIGSWIGG